MKIPVWLLRLLPMWDYICPKCRKEVEKNSSKCPICGEQYGSPVRVPPKVLNDKKALEDYVHKHVFPRVSKTQRDYLAQYFTELFSDGFENGDFSAWTGTSDPSPTVVEVPYSGTYGMLRDADAERCWKYLPSSYSILYMRIYWKTSSLPNTDDFTRIFRVYNASGDYMVAEYANDAGTYKWRLYLTESSGMDTYSQTIDVDTWYCLELKYDATNDLHKLWVDGTERISFSSSVSEQMERVSLGYMDGNWWAHNEYFDCVVVADTYIGTESTTYTKTWTADVLFKKLGITKSLSVDVALQKQDIPKTFAVDAAFQKSLTIQKQIDSLFKKFDILKSFAVDVRFGALMTQTVSRQIDVLLKKLDVTTNFGLDTYFGPVEAETYAKNFGLNVIFAYKVKLPELWLDENGKIVLNISKTYTWVGT